MLIDLLFWVTKTPSLKEVIVIATSIIEVTVPQVHAIEFYVHVYTIVANCLSFLTKTMHVQRENEQGA